MSRQRYRHPILLGRILAVLLFVAVASAASYGNAQKIRGWFQRGLRVQNKAQPQQYDLKDRPSVRQITPRHRMDSMFRIYGPQSYDARIYDPRSPFYDPTTPYPKYIGGFHASEIHNLGIPSGDRGFRGNGIYWSPW